MSRSFHTFALIGLLSLGVGMTSIAAAAPSEEKAVAESTKKVQQHHKNKRQHHRKEAAKNMNNNHTVDSGKETVKGRHRQHTGKGNHGNTPGNVPGKTDVMPGKGNANSHDAND